jgi:hypothetical protein
LKVVTEFNWSVMEIEAAPDGSCFVIEGVGLQGKTTPDRSVRFYGPEGKLLSEIPTQRPLRDAASTPLFDPTGKLLVLGVAPLGEQQILLEMPSGRFLGQTPRATAGVSPGARHFAAVDNAGLHLHDRSGRRVLECLPEIHGLSTPFSPDLDGRYLIWGNESGYVSVADLVEVQRRLAEINLGW